MSSESRDVQLSVPAKPGYLVLARLALAAICRLTPLEPADVADLKLAVTEAAAEFVSEQTQSDGVLHVGFKLSADRLELELSGAPLDGVDHELSRAIVRATVDEADFSPERIHLIKRLSA